MTNDTRSTEANLTVYLGLGSNVGDRQANLREARARIKRLGVEVVRESSIYETEPVGFKDQPWFLNQVIELRLDMIESAYDQQNLDHASSLAVHELHKALQGIEREMGRERTIRDGPRVIDIDLLLCGDGSAMATADPALTIPHPRMHLRRFVLDPLCEIAPEVIHPVLNKTCREILALLDDPSIVRRYDPPSADS